MYIYTESGTDLCMNEDSSNMFSSLNSLEKIDLTPVNSKKVLTMSDLFAYDSNLQEVTF